MDPNLTGDNQPIQPAVPKTDPNLGVVDAPTDPLGQYNPNQSALSARNQTQPPPSLIRTKPYSHSQITARRRNTKRLLKFLLSMASISAITYVGLNYGPGLWQRVSDDPNTHFDAMLVNVMQTSSHEVQVNKVGNFGVSDYSAEIETQEFEKRTAYYQQSTASAIDSTTLDLEAEGYALIEGIDSLRLKVFELSNNLGEINSSNNQAVIDKWFNYPVNVDTSNSIILSAVKQNYYDFSNPYGVIPIGNLENDLIQPALAKLNELGVYRINDCRFNKPTEAEVVICTVSINEVSLNNFYEFITQKGAENYQDQKDVWPTQFTVLIDRQTNLPLEVSYILTEAEIEFTLAYQDFSRDYNFSAPVGSLSFEDYSNLVKDYENSVYSQDSAEE